MRASERAAKRQKTHCQHKNCIVIRCEICFCVQTFSCRTARLIWNGFILRNFSAATKRNRERLWVRKRFAFYINTNPWCMLAHVANYPKLNVPFSIRETLRDSENEFNFSTDDADDDARWFFNAETWYGQHANITKHILSLLIGLLLVNFDFFSSLGESLSISRFVIFNQSTSIR